MPLNLENPTLLAPQLAALLEADPVSAAQIKEHIKPERLLELLDIAVFEGEDEDEDSNALDLADFLSTSNYSVPDLLDYVIDHMQASEILARLNR